MITSGRSRTTFAVLLITFTTHGKEVPAVLPPVQIQIQGPARVFWWDLASSIAIQVEQVVELMRCHVVK
jgi:hypothetical protein